MRVTIVSLESAGLIVRPRWKSPFTIAYGEILTAERMRPLNKLRLHTRTEANVWVACGRERIVVEDALRRRGVRVVDCWGAIVAPTLEDFEHELSREPVRVRQSSDDA